VNSFFSVSLTASNLKSIIARTIIKFAAPIEIGGVRYKDMLDRELD
jgi:hypothetical protein